jgi:hypothetical protein
MAKRKRGRGRPRKLDAQRTASGQISRAGAETIPLQVESRRLWWASVALQEAKDKGQKGTINVTRDQRLGYPLGIVELVVVFRRHDVQIVAAHLHHEEVLRDGVPGQRQRVAESRRELNAVGLGLVQPVRVEPPEAAVLLQELRRVQSLGAPLPVALAVHVVR